MSALAGALATTMASMAGNFTVGKKKFASVEHTVKELLHELRRNAEELLTIMEEDVKAYSTVSEAFSMPKGTDQEKQARKEAIQKALKTALQPPLQAMRAIAKVIDISEELCEIANPNLISDVGVCSAIAGGALLGARLNVEINLVGIIDQQFKDSVSQELEELSSRVETATRVVQKVLQRIRR